MVVGVAVDVVGVAVGVVGLGVVGGVGYVIEVVVVVCGCCSFFPVGVGVDAVAAAGGGGAVVGVYRRGWCCCGC